MNSSSNTLTGTRREEKKEESRMPNHSQTDDFTFQFHGGHKRIFPVGSNAQNRLTPAKTVTYVANPSSNTVEKAASSLEIS